MTVDRIASACLLLVGELLLVTGDPMPGMPKGWSALLVVVITAPVAVRRRWPLAAGLTSVLATALVFIIGANNYSPPLAIAWMCGLYAIAVWTDTRDFLIGFGALVAANWTINLQGHISAANAFQFTVIPGVAMILCRRAIRERHLRAESLAARAELLERERELRAHEAVAEERARIARELHDLVAHNVSVMVVQAGVERHALSDDQAATKEALGSIEQAGRQALTEARRLLGMLRRNGDGGELEPQPTLAEVSQLVEQVERAGLPVTLTVEGERASLPAGLDLCAYRIVQEALTNSLKHAGPAHAAVRVRYAPTALDIEVRDDGRGVAQPAANGAGHGLIGMRERVALYGGELHTGAGEHGGFEVRARLPLA